MSSWKKLILCLSCLVCIATLISCSGVQNREKASSDNSYEGASISLKVLKRSTTAQGVTTDVFDPKLEKTITKSLTKSLIRGSADPSLFTSDALEKAKSVFLDNKGAYKNSAEISLFHLSTDSADDVIVAEVSQKIVSKSKAKTSNGGKIYFDKTGLIVGFDFVNVPESSTTTTREEQA